MRVSEAHLEATREAVGTRFTVNPRRGFWGLVLALHLLAVPSVVEQVTSADYTGEMAAPWARVAWLSISLVFFILKIADVPSLRFRSGRRSVLSATLAIVLFHALVIERSDERVMDAVPRVGLVVMVASLPWWLSTVQRAVRRFTRGLRAWLVSLRRRVDELRRGAGLMHVSLTAPVRVVLRYSRVLRAPPHPA